MKKSKFSRRVICRLTTLFLVIMMFVAQLPNGIVVKAAGTPVTNYQELVDAVSAGGDIEVMNDIAMEGSILVEGNVNITGNGTLYQQKRDVYDTMFKVTGNGSLTLGDGLKLSGKVVEYKEITKTVEKNVEVCEDVVITPATQKPINKTKVVWKKVSENRFNDAKYINEYPNGEEFVDNERLLGKKIVIVNQSETYAVVLGKNNAYGVVNGEPDRVEMNYAPFNDVFKDVKVGDNTYKELQEKYADTAVITLAEFVHSTDINKNNPSYLLQASNGNYIGRSGEGGYSRGQHVSADSTDNNKIYWAMGHDTYNIYFHNSGSTYPAWKAYEDGNYAGNISINTGGGLEKFDVYMQYEVQYTEMEDVPAVTEKQCKFVTETTTETVYEYDFENASCPIIDNENLRTYTVNTFPSNDIDNPRGFFVEVQGSGASFTLDGAHLEDFRTGPGVANVAPVVVNGGSVVMNDGAISHNSVGYSANNEDLKLSANEIGKEKANGTFSDTGKLATYKKTETAGAILLTNKATATVNGGVIEDNRADTGAIVVQGNPDKKADTVNGDAVTSKLFLNGGTIQNNVGIHHAGAVTIYNGAYVEMNEGTLISGNFSWDKGGAIWAREEVYGSNNKGTLVVPPVGKATFIMNGGELSNNMTINRGGAIEVMSNHVSLLGGKIINNKSRVLGGAIYVEGDGPTRNYRLYIPEGDIVKNSAVHPNNTAALQKRVTSSCDCGAINTFAEDAGSNVADKQDFNNHYGFGGGLWLCPIGGSAALTSLDDEYEVYIGDNTAGDNKGKDIRIQPFRGGAINGISVFNKGKYNEFYTGNTPIEEGNVYNGPVNIYNKNAEHRVNSGVLISGNTAAAGGAIASNGIVMFGKAKDVYTANASLKVAKKWSGQIENRENVTVSLYTYFDGVRGDMLESASVKLDGTVDEPGENTAAYESDSWTAYFGVPLSYETKDGIKPLIILDINGVEVDPSTLDGVTALKDAVKSGSTINIKQWNVEVVETDKEGKELTYKLPKGEVVLNTKITDEKEDSIKTASGEELAKFMTGNIAMEFSNTIGNDTEPEIEKYVNEAVHKPISLDEVFKYDILAYVTMDADKVVITDELVSDLEFAPGTEVTILDIGERVNHQVNNNVNGIEVNTNGSVGTNAGDAVYDEENPNAVALDITNNDGVTITKDNNELVVTLDNEVTVNEEAGTITREYDTVSKLHGRWVKVSFYAQIKEELQKAINEGTKTLEDLANVKVKAEDNNPVLSDEAHNGVDNKAGYGIEVENKATYEDESNTVTVKPEEPEIEKYVNEAVHEYVGLEDSFTYDIMAYVTKNADKVVISDELDKNLVFDENYEIVVKDMGMENNHNVTNNIYSVKVDEEEASTVSSEGIVLSDYVLSTENNKLEVTLDDEVTVDEESGTIKRNKTTVKDLRGHWIKVTFTAKFKEDVKVEELELVEIKGEENKPVNSEEDHSGVANKAKYTITPNNGAEMIDESNTVTVKPEEPEIEKYVNEAVHKFIGLEDEFTYDIVAYITNDADSAVITDELNAQLQFVSSAEDIEVIDLGTENNHKVTNNIYSEKVNEDSSVSKDGTKVDANVEIVDGRVLRINIEDAKAYRGHWVKATFTAKISDDAVLEELEYVEVKADQEEERNTPNKGNNPVISEEDHAGVPNKAAYTIIVDDNPKYEDESNTVTVKPEKPEIEKFVNEAVHEFIKLEDTFTYDIVAYVTKDADSVVISDKLNEQLEFVSSDKDVKVVDLGENNNHEVTNDIYSNKVSDTATVAEEGEPVENAEVSINGDTLTVNIKDASNNRGHWVKVTFDAKIKEGLKVEDLAYTEIDATKEENRAVPNVGNDPVVSEENHAGVPNKAAYTIIVDDNPKYEDESNTVTVKPEEPEIEKYVNEAVHEFVGIGEEFTYDILAYVPFRSDKVVVVDKLNEQLQFLSTPESVSVVNIGSDNNHKVTNNIYSELVNDDASVANEGVSVEGYVVEIDENSKTLTVTIENELEKVDGGYKNTEANQYVTPLRGSWIKVTFKAQIDPSLELSDLELINITENNPVLSDEVHDGIPNKASYTITIGNDVEMEDESNTVTVRPEKPEIEKYVNEAVHTDINMDEVFKYDIIAYITKDADYAVISDTLDNQLQFISKAEDIKVVDLGTSTNHKVTNNIRSEKVNDDASVASEGTPIENATVSIENETLSVKLDDASAYRGHWVKVTFEARIKESVTFEELKYTDVKANQTEDRDLPNVGNAPVISDEDHNGVPNKASYSIGVKDNPNMYTDNSNTVTVKPKTIAIPVLKVWDDRNNENGYRTNSVVFALLKDGKEYMTVEVSKDTEWKAVFMNLPADGEYSVIEKTVVYGYEAPIITGNRDEGFTVINALRPNTPETPDKPTPTPTPDIPTTPKTPDKPTPKVPDTSDGAHTGAWTIIFLSSLAITIGLIGAKKKLSQ